MFLKSHATRFGTDICLEVFASTWAPDRTTAEARVVRALALVAEALGEAPSVS